MVKLKTQTALGADVPLSATIGVLSISENNNLALASLTKPKTSKASQVFGMSLPDIGRYSTKDAHSVFWIGPDQWMVCGDGKAELNFAQEVKSQVPDAYVTEQSNGWVCFDVVSSMDEKPIENLLERLINIDLQLVKAGQCVRTGLHHMNVCVVRPDANNVSIFGMRSFAGSLWYHLRETAERL